MTLQSSPLVFSLADPNLWEKLRAQDLKQAIWVSPTDTVYGFGAVYSNLKGLAAIQALKGVGPQPAIALVKNAAQAGQFTEVSDAQADLLGRYWPGPISFVLKLKGEDRTLALRCPADPFLQKLLDLTGEPIYSTSCNLHGKTPAESALEALAQFPRGVDFFVDGGIRQNLTPSTLVDLTGEQPRVLRRGAVSFD